MWGISSNNLSFMNPLKMKMSVLLGVIHMMFGICLSCANHLYKKDWIGVFCEFIPQVLFMGCMFGYLCTLIIWKWLSIFEPGKDPSLLVLLINMFLQPTSVSHAEHTKFYEGQVDVQLILLMFILGSAPIMLLGRPLIG